MYDVVACCGVIYLFPDTAEALSEMARVSKGYARLSVMTFVRRRFLWLKRVYEHLREDYRALILDVEDLIHIFMMDSKASCIPFTVL